MEAEAQANYTKLCSKKTLHSKDEGFFNGLVEKVSPFIDPKVLSTCSTDKARIRYCVTRCWDLVGAELIFRGKDAEDSIEKRLKGNEAFEKGNLRQALLLYCQSLIRAPVGPQIALVYSNRSALLQKMGEFQLAINDAEMAISYDYSETNRHKLYERMTSCYISLANFPKAKVTLSLARHLAGKHAAEDVKFTKKLGKLKDVIDTKSKIVENHSNKENQSDKSNGTKMTKSNPKNRKFPVASTKFDVTYSENHGRYAVATEAIVTGEEILREKPFANVLMPERMGTHCLNCFKRLKACIPCETCANVAFCSLKCRQEAEKYHQYECRVLALFCGAGISLFSHLALRMVTQSSAAAYVEEFANFQSKPSELLVDDGTFDSSSYTNVFNLAALENERAQEDFVERGIMAVFLMKCLRLVGYFKINIFLNPQATEDELTIGAILLRNLQVLQFNAYEISEFVMESKDHYRKSRQQNLGLAIYNTGSFFNHSCAPNVSRYFDGTSMIIESIEPIGKGEAISDNYGPIFTKVSTINRQNLLKGRYWFDCTCQACKEEWPLVVEMKSLEERENKYENQIVNQLKKLKEMYFDKASELMDRGQGIMAAEFLKKYLELSQELLNKLEAAEGSKCKKIYHKSFYMAQEALKLCISSKGSVHVLETK